MSSPSELVSRLSNKFLWKSGIDLIKYEVPRSRRSHTKFLPFCAHRKIHRARRHDCEESNNRRWEPDTNKLPRFLTRDQQRPEFKFQIPIARSLLPSILCNVSKYVKEIRKSNECSIHFKPWKTKRRRLYLKTHFVPRRKHFSSRFYKNQSVYVVWGRSHSFFSDKYQTCKHSVGRAYDCWMLNLLVHHVTSGL